MKKLFAIIICVVAALNVWAGDNDDYIQVDWYPLFTDSVGWNIYSGGFVIGWNNASGIETDMGHSMELGWLNVVGAKFNSGHGQRITIGVGIDWRNFRLEKGQRFVTGDEKVAIVPYPEGATSQLSRVKVFSLTVPLLIRQRLFGKMDIFAGPVVNFNLHASALTRYTINGETITEKSNHIHQVPVTVDVMGGLKWGFLGAYVRYNPCHVLKEAHAPAFTSLTAGIFMGF